jgi:hypothetical protein
MFQAGDPAHAQLPPMTNAITTVAGELCRIVGAEPRAPHASTQWQVGQLTVILSRSLDRW